MCARASREEGFFFRAPRPTVTTISPGRRSTAQGYPKHHRWTGGRDGRRGAKTVTSCRFFGYHAGANTINTRRPGICPEGERKPQVEIPLGTRNVPRQVRGLLHGRLEKTYRRPHRLGIVRLELIKSYRNTN